jgi:3-phenylpropionate/trans-cinnamate dioxygenase ferredoxin reductase subunit
VASSPVVVVVGANLAGGRAVETLRSEGFDGRIVLIGEEPHRPYERPPMSKDVLRGEAEPAKAFLRDESWYAENEIELMLGTRAHMLDLHERVVMAGGSLVPFDALLLATGGTARHLDVPGATLPGIHPLRTMDDAIAVRAPLAGGARVCVAGAGFIGCEVAASARSVGCEVAMVDHMEFPLGKALGPEIGRVIGSMHRDHGVALHMGAGIERFEGAGRVERVVLSDGSTIDADLVVVGVGIEPNDELAAHAGIECRNGILVDERCMTSARGVFAAGDVANHPNPILAERIRIEHWQNAQNQGAAAAKAILGKLDAFAEVPWFWSDQFHVNIQMSGHPVRYDRIVFRGSVDDRSFSAIYRDGERIVGVLGVNHAKDVRAGRRLVGHGAGIDDATLADEGSDLRALAEVASS